MLIRNNPELDYDALEVEVNRRLAAYRERGDWVAPADFSADPAAGAPVSRATRSAKARSALQRLYALEDAAFVRRAHRVLLGRNPTPAELAQRLDALRMGENKSRLLYQLRYSAEGKAHGSGLDIPLQRAAYSLMAVPVLGKAFEWAVDLLSISGLRRRSQAQINALQRELTLADEEQTRHSDSQMQRVGAEIDALRRTSELRMQASSEQIVLLEQQLATLKMRLTQLEGSTSSAQPRLPAVDAGGVVNPEIAPALYVALENAFRGSEESIRERLSHHLQRLQGLSALQPGQDDCSELHHAVVDLGSGRGEWLALLADHGIAAVGIETNIANIEQCRERGQNVHARDALAWLAEQPSNSIAAITAFHLIEHLPFASAHALISQAARCLVPGGLLLLETPNPENLLVASASFHLDPTHIKPLPPALLEFLLNYCGLANVNVERLHPVAEHLMLPDTGEVSRRCNHLFYAAQDYAVSGSKQTT